MAIKEVFESPAYREHMSKLGKKGGSSRSQAKRLASQRNLDKTPTHRGRPGPQVTTNG